MTNVVVSSEKETAVIWLEAPAVVEDDGRDDPRAVDLMHDRWGGGAAVNGDME